MTRIPSLALRLIQTPNDLEAALPLLARERLIGLDLETTGLDPHQARIRLLSLALPQAGEVLLVDLFRLPGALEGIRPFLEAGEGALLVGHNLAFDLGFLMARGLFPSGRRLWDTGLAQQVLRALPRMPALKDLLPVDKSLQVSDWGGELSQRQLEYAARDAVAVLVLYKQQIAEARKRDLVRALALEMRALPAVAWMRVMGVPFDPNTWSLQIEEAMAEAERALERLARFEDGLFQGSLNWNSPKQALEALRRHGIAVSGTREEDLAPYRNHPLVEALLDYREAQKRVSAFGERWLEYLHPKTGRIHPEWKQIGAETGRMACARPNLQQVPRDATRRAFRAPEGRVLIKADYSQIELRLAAAIAPDPVMAEAFRKGEDLHTLTASRILGKPMEAVSKADRQLAKALNFGLIYGMGAESLRQYALTGYGVALSPEEASRLREAFFQLYPGLRAWHRRTPQGEVEVETLMGRKRRTSRFTEKLNTPVQGSGADGLKLALGLLYEHRHEVPGAFPVLAVHDEVVVEAPAERAEEALVWVRRIMVEAMERVMARAPLPVPVEVEAGVYQDWGFTSTNRCAR